MTDEELIKSLRGWMTSTSFDDDAHAAADRIEELLLEITSLNTVIDMLHVAWDQTTEELQRENKRLRKANSDMGWELNPDRMGGQFTEEEINRGNEWR